MAKFKYEFEIDGFTKGACYSCPLSYTDYSDEYWTECCVLSCSYDKCLLVEVKDDKQLFKREYESRWSGRERPSYKTSVPLKKD